MCFFRFKKKNWVLKVCEFWDVAKVWEVSRVYLVSFVKRHKLEVGKTRFGHLTTLPLLQFNMHRNCRTQKYENATLLFAHRGACPSTATTRKTVQFWTLHQNNTQKTGEIVFYSNHVKVKDLQKEIDVLWCISLKNEFSGFDWNKLQILQFQRIFVFHKFQKFQKFSKFIN